MRELPAVQSWSASHVIMVGGAVGTLVGVADTIRWWHMGVHWLESLVPSHVTRSSLPAGQAPFNVVAQQWRLSSCSSPDRGQAPQPPETCGQAPGSFGY